MPIAPAAQATLILTPLLVAAGFAIYDAHRDEINTFVRDRLDDIREIAEDIGLRDRRRHAAGWGASGAGGESGEAYRHLLRSRRRWRRRSSGSLDQWPRRGAAMAGSSRSRSPDAARANGVEGDTELTEMATIASASGVEGHTQKLRRRGAGGESERGSAINTKHTIPASGKMEEEQDGGEAPVPNAFEDLAAAANTPADHTSRRPTEANDGQQHQQLQPPAPPPQQLEIPTAAPSSAPATPSTLALRTPTSSEGFNDGDDPMDFDMLDYDSRSEAALSGGHRFESGPHTPTSEEDEEDDFARLSTASSWSAVSSRVDEHEAQ